MKFIFSLLLIGILPAASVAQILDRYTCERALIQISLDAHTSKNWDAVIAKANECYAIDPSAVELSIRGEAYREKGNMAASLADYTQAIQLEKRDIDTTKKLMNDFGDALFKENYNNAVSYLVGLYVERSDVYVLKGDRRNAEADLKAALAVEPTSYSAADKLKDLDKNIAAKQKEARIANPRTAADFILSGTEYYRNNKYKEALTAFEKAIMLDGKNAEAYIGHGNTNRQMYPNDLDIAINDYNKAVNFAPKMAEAYKSRGYAYKNKKDWDAAINDLSTAMKLSSATASLLNARGDTYLGKEKYNEALADFENALKVAGNDKFEWVTAQSGVGDAYMKLGRDAEGLEAYNKAIAGGKADFFANIMLLTTYVSRGNIYARKGMKAEAEADYKAALKISPKYEDAKTALAKLNETSGASAGATGGKSAEEWSVLGRQQFQGQQFDDAIASFTKSIQLSPTVGYYYSLRGFAQATKGNMAAFKIDFDQAVRLSPADQTVFYLRGIVYMSKGMKPEATADFRKVVQIDPTHEAAKARLKELE